VDAENDDELGGVLVSSGAGSSARRQNGDADAHREAADSERALLACKEKQEAAGWVVACLRSENMASAVGEWERKTCWRRWGKNRS
jgi:hypothetical protein